jgi:hypothetical protein
MTEKDAVTGGTDPERPPAPQPLTRAQARELAEDRLSRGILAALNVPQQQLAAALRGALNRPDLAETLPDEVLAGLFTAQLVSAIGLGGTGATDRASIWRMLGAVWATQPGGAPAPGTKAAEPAVDGAAVMRGAVVIADVVEAALARAAAGRAQAPAGRIPVTLDGVTGAEVAETRASRPTVHLLGEQVHAGPAIPPPDRDPIKVAPRAPGRGAMGGWDEQSDPLGRWPD